MSIVKYSRNISFIENGNIFNSKMSTIVNTVNTKGTMGKGLAKKFSKKYPGMENEYIKRCKKSAGKKRLTTSRPFLYKSKDKQNVLNFATKEHYWDNSELEYIENGLKYFVKNYKKAGIKSIAFPKLGAGLGGLDWHEVRTLMLIYLMPLKDLKIEIYGKSPDKPCGTVYTTSFKSLNKAPKTKNQYLITRGKRDEDETGLKMLQSFAPEKDLFQKYLKEWKGMDNYDWWEEYYPIFEDEFYSSKKKVALVRKIQRKLINGEDFVFVCFCKNVDVCHRSIIGDIFYEKGIKIISL